MIKNTTYNCTSLKRMHVVNTNTSTARTSALAQQNSCLHLGKRIYQSAQKANYVLKPYNNT